MLDNLDHSFNGHIKADVCIAGAGPAGIVLALTLAELGVSSILLEAGTLEPPGPEGRDPYKGEVTGLPYPLSGSRLRYFGGTSNVWGGWCKPLDAIDFGQRIGAPLPSWPFALEDLDQHYRKSLGWCEIGNGDFEAGTSVAEPAKQLLFQDEAGFTTRIMRFSPPTRFGSRYLEAIESNELIHCFTHATLTSMKYKANAVSLADTTGTDFGNQSELLGCCFMDHFGFHPGYLAARSGLKHYRHKQEGVDILPLITSSQQMQAQFDLPSVCMIITPDEPSEQLPPPYFANPGVLGSSPVESLRYHLQLICEPTAHAASRITLSGDKDAFGVGRIKLDWRILDEDYEKVEQFMRQFELAVGRNGLGRVQRTRRFKGEIRRKLSGGWHHMGTTRMSDHPKFGVVDSNCRVFGSSNLYISGSSVFPRVGYSNPTLTIIALADRLARHLHQAST